MKNKHSLDNSTLLEMFQSQDRGTGDHMEENRQKVIAMAMKICIESSDDDSDDSDTDLYRIAKKPKMAASNNDIEAMPASDLNLIRRFSVELLPDQQNFLRLDDLTFEKLLTLVQSSQYSDPIAGAKQTLTVRERLVLTLSYLATGRNYNELVFSSPKTAQIINQIILETCDLLYKALRGEYMKVFVCEFYFSTQFTPMNMASDRPIFEISGAAERGRLEADRSKFRAQMAV